MIEISGSVWTSAIFSSPKKLELKTQSLFNPIILKPKIYWKITSADMKSDVEAAEIKKYLKLIISNSLR